MFPAHRVMYLHGAKHIVVQSKTNAQTRFVFVYRSPRSSARWGQTFVWRWTP